MENNQELDVKPKKKGHFFIIFWLLLVVGAFVITKYLFEEKKYHIFTKSATNEGLSNIDTKIYNKESDVAQLEISRSPATKSDSEQLVSVNDEYSSKDLYASIIRQQLQLDILQEKFMSLKIELGKIRNQDKLSKIIISFVEVKDCLEAQKNCTQQLEKLIILAKTDPDLTQRISDLQEVLKTSPKNSNQLSEQFHSLIPSLMAIKYGNSNGESFFGKIKRNISELIVIRRVDGIVGNSSENIDFVIVETERLIESEKYHLAISLLSNQEEKYRLVLENMIIDLQNADYLDKILKDIFDYLKSY